MLTSHYMQDIEELCDRVIIIDHGKIFFDGPLSDDHRPVLRAQDHQPDFRRQTGARLFRARRSGRADAGQRAAESPARESDRSLPSTAERLFGLGYQRAGIAGRRCDSPAFRRAQRGESRRPTAVRLTSRFRSTTAPSRLSIRAHKPGSPRTRPSAFPPE